MIAQFRRLVAGLLILALALPFPAQAALVATDAEAAQLVSNIDELPAGGIGIVGAIVLVFLVLLVTDILGYTKVFPFTKPIR
jgi:hypothetical protein